jgi:hypothetical protein
MRDNIVTDIRPIVLTEAANETDLERFQNATLRPILKFQNDILKALLLHYFQKRKGEYFKIAEENRPAYIEHAVRKDLRFKSQLLGVVVGIFTAAEFDVFIKNEAELSRRATDLLVQRLCGLDFV